ncbi:hypothetical protein [Halorubrum sp. DM2]|uniref:hypothetical protein n=1 Tax=Halorubrum sp. DM2 TaxID=2527867 RepID=UPI0024B6BE81|nr:hypothetical protein [Halorubrum sp. DM2]
MTIASETILLSFRDEQFSEVVSISTDPRRIEDLANAYALYHQLHKQHWNIEGAIVEMLREQPETPEEHTHHIEHYLEDDTVVFESATQ